MKPAIEHSINVDFFSSSLCQSRPVIKNTFSRVDWTNLVKKINLLIWTWFPLPSLKCKRKYTFTFFDNMPTENKMQLCEHFQVIFFFRILHFFSLIFCSPWNLPLEITPKVLKFASGSVVKRIFPSTFSRWIFAKISIHLKCTAGHY